MPEALALVGLGSNIEPLRHVPAAMRALRRCGEVAGRAELVRTPAVGPPGQPDFVNGAVLLRTGLAPRPLVAALKQIEARLGRVRTADRYAPRTIDLDLLVHDREVVDPDVRSRPFLTAALVELVPEVPVEPSFHEPRSADPEVRSVVRELERELGPRLVSVFGAGSWFAGEACPTSQVRFVAVSDRDSPGAEDGARKRLDRAGLGRIRDRPVRLRLCSVPELRDRSIRHFPFWSLLHGRPWPVAEDLPPPRPPEEELRRLRRRLERPPDLGFLRTSRPTGEVFDWPDYVRTYLRARLLEASLEEGRYHPSFERLRRRLAAAPGDLVHKAVAYRYYGFDLRPSRRRAFRRRILREF